MKNKLLINIINVLYIIFSFSLAGSMYLQYLYPNTTFEQLFFSLFSGSGGTPRVIIFMIIFYTILFAIPLLIILLIPKIIKKFLNYEVELKIVFRIKCILTIVFLTFSLYNIGFINYISYQFKESKIYEKRYVDPSSVDITFNKKKNLIYIYVESMESTYSNLVINNKKVSLIKNLEKLAKENVNFSDTSNVGGAYELYGTNWTKAADVSTSSGINSKIDFNSYFKGKYKKDFKGASSLGEILKSFGYENYLLLGSEPEFAGTSKFYKLHGDYNIMGFSQAKKLGYVKEKDYKNWGIEDIKLLDIAKKELTKIAKKDKPFNYTIFTIDSHFPGYVNSTCKKNYKDIYADSIACEDKIISEFVEWILKQDFYKDTVIVITGDHLAMERKSYLDKIDRKKRKIYNVFINSEVTSANYKNRLFSTLDMFPTVLASMGAEIEGNRLGLGVNLFSNEPTIIEEYGYDVVNKKLKSKSNYYIDNILK